MSTVTKLPYEQQQKRARLVEEAQAANIDPLNAPPSGDPAPVPSVPRPQAQEPVAPTQVQDPAPQAPEPRQPEPSGDAVSVSREELDALRADAERTRAMERRLQSLELELAESQAMGLTGAALPPSGSVVAEPSAPSSAAPAPSGGDWRPLSTDGLDLSDEEAKEYSESEPIITKLAKREAARQINEAVAPLVNRIASLERTLKQTTGRIDQTNESAFVSQVRKEVANFDEVVGHKHWRAFLQSQNPHSSFSFGEELNKAHGDRNLAGTAKVFKAFAEKYLHDPAKAAAYSGVTTTSASSSAPAQQTGPEVLKMSERRQASDDFIKGKITKAELQVVVDKFKKAENEGRIDYNS